MQPAWRSRNFFRGSESGDCSLHIQYKLASPPAVSDEERDIPLPLAFGTALEPVINKHIRLAHGLELSYFDENQIEVGTTIRTHDEITFKHIGHPDGICFKGDRPFSDKFRKLVPQEALDVLDTPRGVLGWEVKTMNPDNFKAFRAYGLEGTEFLHHYYDQAQLYLTGFDPNEAVVGDNEYTITPINPFDRALPGTLLCAMNTGTKEMAFTYIKYDPEYYATVITPKLIDIAWAIEKGVWVEATLDGKSLECQFCEFSNICPKVDKIINPFEGMPLETLSPEKTTEYVQRAIYLADRLSELQTTQEITEGEIEAIRDEVKQLMMRLRTKDLVVGDYAIQYSPTAGRKMIDKYALERMAGAMGFEVPYTTSEAGSRIVFRKLERKSN